MFGLRTGGQAAPATGIEAWRKGSTRSLEECAALAQELALAEHLPICAVLCDPLPWHCRHLAEALGRSGDRDWPAVERGEFLAYMDWLRTFH